MVDEREDEKPDKEEQQEEEQEQEATDLIFGKYKTMDEAERGYKELERDFHERRQAKEPEPEPAEDYGYVGLPPGTAASEAAPDPNDAFYENPAQFVVQTIAQIRQVERLAVANRRAAMRELKSHPAFAAVQDDVESLLEQMEPAYLADPAQARQVVRALFGERLVERTAKPEGATKTAPLRRMAADVEEPDSAGSDTSEVSVDTEGDELLKSLGLAGKSRAAVVKSWNERQREARRGR